MARQTLLQGPEFKYIKGGMYALNLLVVILGLALGGVGVWIRIDFKAKEYREVLDPVFKLCEEEDSDFDFSIRLHMDTIAYFLIFLGVAIVCTGLLGVCGTVKERTTVLAMFCILLFMIFAILLTAGIQAMVKKDSFVKCEDRLSERLILATKGYYLDDAKKEFMDQVQKHVGCCGATEGARDYDPTKGPYPCAEKFKLLSCDRAIKDFFNAIGDNMIMILVVSFCIGIFTGIGMGMSAYLFSSLRRIKRKLYK